MGYAAGAQNAAPYYGAQGAALGYAAANQNAAQAQYAAAQGAAMGYAAGAANPPPVSTTQVALPTDAGFSSQSAGSAAPPVLPRELLRERLIGN